MNKILAALSAASILAIAAPAVGQTYQNQNNVNANAYGQANTVNRIARLETRIDAGVQSGQISNVEARNLRQQLRTITRLERQYSRNGLTTQERTDLQQRLRAFREDLRLAGGMGYGNGQYGQNGQYGNQNGTYNDGYYGQGGPYENVECDTGSSGGGIGGLGGGLGGLIDSIFGGGSDNGECAGLRVGQRVSGNLSALPYEYRNQFRDGNGIAYRTDGRNIYQIDTRSSTVLRVYGMNR